MRRRPQAPPRKRSSGAALVAVLLVLSLLTVLAMSVVSATRRHAQLGKAAVATAVEQEILDSAIRLAVLTLGGAGNAGGCGDTLPMTVFDRTVGVALSCESGRVDLNMASADLLTAAFAGNEVSVEQATSYAARIVDWRDADDERGTGGAERDDYLGSGRKSGPRNAPFENVAELTQVLGLERLDGSMLDAFTVYSHAPDVREQAAVPVALRALQWADAKQLGGRRWLAEATETSAMVATSRSLAGEAVRLKACTSPPTDAYCRVATVRLTGNESRPVLVFAWQTVAG